MTFSERLQRALDDRAMSQAELARRVEVNPSTVNHWLSGRREPPSQTVGRITAALDVRAAWLAFGDGAMTETADAPPPTPPTPKRRTISPPAAPSASKKRPTVSKKAARASKPGPARAKPRAEIPDDVARAS